VSAEPDLYRRLGVDPSATAGEIAAAFRAGAKALHPDVRPGDEAAAARFRALTEAYDVLGRPERRSTYDRRRPEGHPVRAPVRWEPFLRTPRRARAALWSGIALALAGVGGTIALATALTADTDTAQAVTLWIVAIKLVVCGGIIAVAGGWRLHRFRAAP
jgi:hypothetical protein